MDTSRQAHPPSLWAEETPPRQLSEPLQGDRNASALVIGGGFTGLSTAFHLAQDQADVVLLEATQVGAGASGRNNGQVIPTLSGAEPGAMIERYGDAGERLARLVAQSAEGVFRLANSLGIDCEQEQTGWFQPAHSVAALSLSEQRVRAWQDLEAPVQMLDRDEARELLGSDGWYGGMLNPTGGHINPLALARGLADAANAAGAQIFEYSPAISLHRNGQRWRADTPTGSVTADVVILASNAYTDVHARKLCPALSGSMVPILSWQMATEPLGDNLRQTIIPGRHAVSDTRADLQFFRYDARHRLVTGGAVLGNFRVARRVQAKTAQRLSAAWPELSAPRFDFVWSGRLSMTRDRFPHFHKLGPDLWGWTGCNGRGVALSMALGQQLARASMGASPADLSIPLGKPDMIPWRGLATRIAPLALAWYRLKDKQGKSP